MEASAVLIPLVTIPFVVSLFALSLPSNARNAEAWLSGATALALFLIAASQYPHVSNGGVIRQTLAWVPQLGLNMAFRMDGFAWLFTMLITGIGFLVVIYARYYMSPEDPVPRFYAYLLAFMGSMLGVVNSGNLIQIVVFWELTSIFSFLLIGYWYHNAAARDGARMALTITGVGGLCLLAGMLMIGMVVGSYDLDKVLESGAMIRGHKLYLPILILVLIGTFTKSAQFPFHVWLPNAMAAPTPVSAYLHSATMVKAGVFMMARLWPVLSGTPEWFTIVGLAGMASLLLGAYFAIFQQDIKGLLAYSTISHLGLITMLLSLGSPLAAVAAIFHMANHATFKASLFMAAGIIDHEAGTRDMRKLGGLFRFMPVTATLAMVAAAAMAGVPLLNGFISKEMFFAEAIEHHADSPLDTAAPYIAILASAFAVTYSVRFIHGVFFGRMPDDIPVKEPHEPPFFMRLPAMLLVLICLIVGVLPGATIGIYLNSAAIAVLGLEMPPYSLSIWHGFNLPLIMSLLALVAGVLLYGILKNYLATSEEGPPYFRELKGQRIFERVMVSVSWRWARLLESWLGTRRLQPQLRLLSLIAVLAAALAIGRRTIPVPNISFAGADLLFTGLWIIGIACAIGAAYQAKYHRLFAVILMGGAGLVTCITFIWLSAPDLALTQLVVEVVTTVLILLGLRWLPKRIEGVTPDSSLRARARRSRDMVLALSAGAGTAFLSYLVMTRYPPPTIADYFLENAYTQGGGRNVVNVILVDFRGFDTFGEITVLGIVALTVFALLRRFRPAPDSIESPEQQILQIRQIPGKDDEPSVESHIVADDYLYVPSVIMQWLFPVIIVLAAYLFLRGHDSPGGGFVAGVAMASAFILQYMATGTRWVEERLRVLPVKWMGFGLLVAAATGAGSWLFGYPFLTSHAQYVEVPFIGKVPAATAMIFDTGIFSLVMGATVLMLVAIAHQSIRKLRAAKIPATTPETM